MVFQMILLLGSINPFVHAVSLANDSCQEYCGDVRIPYPFGIGSDCYYNEYFAISCNNSNPFLTMIEKDVLEISLEGWVRVNYSIPWSYDDTSFFNYTELSSSPFIFSQSRNRFVAVGCNTFASLNSRQDDSVIGGCMSFCEEKPKRTKVTSCNGIECCQTTIPSDLDVFDITIKPTNDESLSTAEIKYAFIVEQRWLEDNITNPILVKNMSMVPVVLEWGMNTTELSHVINDMLNYSNYFCENSSTSTGKLSSTFTCFCRSGFEGNLYLPQTQECTDIDECKNSKMCSSSSPGNQTLRCVNTYGSHFCAPDEIINKPQSKMIIIVICTGLGVLVLLIGGWWSYKWVKKRKNIKRKEKFFKRNGGLLLQQQLSSSEVNVEKTKLFNSKDLEKATDRFNVNRILGQGGQGTVYKGMLVDGRIVAVKKSKVIDEGKLKEFINEVVILSQINHRNVVKLLGCCLETEVPLLVYEFIPNGTLSQYLYEQNEEFSLTWDMRLRIATEVAGALFYLHSAASSPIYHRDIKTTNILLDEKYRAKVADFGTARSITVDQTHLTTVVQGTYGYLDPEYFQSNQFTEKSDVYSFGVVLVELLTGEKAISSTRAQESRSLATYFIHSIEENNLFDILDARVVKDAKKEEIIKVANLAKMCLNLNRKKRPTMKEVTKQLEAVQMLQKAPNVQQKYEDVEYPKTEMYEQWDDISISTIPSMDNGASSSGTHPMLSI
ncbi:wall-associated receptor kinase-like 1 [Fagus crenata]